MLSPEERQELAENAMEELATGLNRAAQAMKSNEGVREDLTDLHDTELHLLLEEAYNYKTIKKDKHGLSGAFKDLLEKVEENSSGEEQWDITFRRHLNHQDSTGKKKKRKVSESSKKGGSLSNLSLISDCDSSSRSSKRKSGRSSVSSRSREGGSLPPTKFENAVFGGVGAATSDFASPTGASTGGGSASPPPHHASTISTSSTANCGLLGWDNPSSSSMPGKVMYSAEDPQSNRHLVHTGSDPYREPARQLAHSTSDSVVIRQMWDNRPDTSIDIEGADTDSNKTEVEEIEMEDMAGRAEYTEIDESTALLQSARHRMETRGRVSPEYGSIGSDWSREPLLKPGDAGLDENGNPASTSSSTSVTTASSSLTSSSVLSPMGSATSTTTSKAYPIMDPQFRPISIYRTSPIFQGQRMTVPSLPSQDNSSQARNREVISNAQEEKAKLVDTNTAKRKPRRKKEEDKNVKKAEEIPGYRGHQDVDVLLDYIEDAQTKDSNVRKPKASSKKSLEKSSSTNNNNNNNNNASNTNSDHRNSTEKEKMAGGGGNNTNGKKGASAAATPTAGQQQNGNGSSAASDKSKKKKEKSVAAGGDNNGEKKVDQPAVVLGNVSQTTTPMTNGQIPKKEKKKKDNNSSNSSNNNSRTNNNLREQDTRTKESREETNGGGLERGSSIDDNDACEDADYEADDPDLDDGLELLAYRSGGRSGMPSVNQRVHGKSNVDDETIGGGAGSVSSSGRGTARSIDLNSVAHSNNNLNNGSSSGANNHHGYTDKGLSLSSSPPLDIDHDLLMAEERSHQPDMEATVEFTKVTKKQRRRKDRYQSSTRSTGSGSAFSHENRSRVPPGANPTPAGASGDAESISDQIPGQSDQQATQGIKRKGASSAGSISVSEGMVTAVALSNSELVGGANVGASGGSTLNSSAASSDWNFPAHRPHYHHGRRPVTGMAASREPSIHHHGNAKSTCSVPPSDASDTDDHDSVHSLPVGSTRAKVTAPACSVSSGHTPQASYADIARHAAALNTQQAGKQQNQAYRDQLKHREVSGSASSNGVPTSAVAAAVVSTAPSSGNGVAAAAAVSHSKEATPGDGDKNGAAAAATVSTGGAESTAPRAAESGANASGGGYNSCDINKENSAHGEKSSSSAAVKRPEDKNACLCNNNNNSKENSSAATTPGVDNLSPTTTTKNDVVGSVPAAPEEDSERGDSVKGQAASSPVHGFTFGFEVNNELLRMSEEMVRFPANASDSSSSSRVIDQNFNIATETPHHSTCCTTSQIITIAGKGNSGNYNNGSHNREDASNSQPLAKGGELHPKARASASAVSAVREEGSAVVVQSSLKAAANLVSSAADNDDEEVDICDSSPAPDDRTLTNAVLRSDSWVLSPNMEREDDYDEDDLNPEDDDRYDSRRRREDSTEDAPYSSASSSSSMMSESGVAVSGGAGSGNKLLPPRHSSDPSEVRNFNYDVIVDFVNQAWDAISSELVSGEGVVTYYSERI